MIDKEQVLKAIDEWYSTRYPLGVRLIAQQRESLAEHIARRIRDV